MKYHFISPVSNFNQSVCWYFLASFHDLDVYLARQVEMEVQYISNLLEIVCILSILL